MMSVNGIRLADRFANATISFNTSLARQSCRHATTDRLPDRLELKQSLYARRFCELDIIYYLALSTHARNISQCGSRELITRSEVLVFQVLTVLTNTSSLYKLNDRYKKQRTIYTEGC